MAKKSFAVMGATGQIGRAIAEELLRRGHEVRAVARDLTKLETLRVKGARVHPASFDDATAITEAFRGASAVFSFIPPGYGADDFGVFQDRVGEAIAAGIRNAEATHALDLSSLGADLPQGTGPILGLHRHEKRLESIPGLAVLHLRPGYFMENLLWSIPAIRTQGIHPSALRGDLPIAMVATRDIGAKAADLLDRLDFRGRTVVEFQGPHRVTMKEATAAIGRAIGKPDLPYVQVTYEDSERAMLGMGMKPSIVGLMTEMTRALNDGKIEPRQPAAPDRQGMTSIEHFAQIFAKAYRGG